MYLSGLDRSVTLPDVLMGIAKTAPVGMVLSARLNHHTPSSPRDEHEAQPIGARKAPDMKADILFGNEDAPLKLLNLARRSKFLVQGKTPHVTINPSIVFSHPRTHVSQSRVLHVRGPPDTEGFDEETIRGVLARSEAVMRRGMSTDSEPVETRHDDRDGSRVMEWRFFDSRQARAFKAILQKHYGWELQIRSVADPCWDYQAMWKYIRRASESPKEPPVRPLYPAVRGGEEDGPWEDNPDDFLELVHPPSFNAKATQTEETTSTEKRPSSVDSEEKVGH